MEQNKGTPRKINIEPENDGLEMFGRWFTFSKGPVLSDSNLNLPGRVKRWTPTGLGDRPSAAGDLSGQTSIDNEPLDDREKLIERFAGYRFVPWLSWISWGLLWKQNMTLFWRNGGNDLLPKLKIFFKKRYNIMLFFQCDGIFEGYQLRSDLLTGAFSPWRAKGRTQGSSGSAGEVFGGSSAVWTNRLEVAGKILVYVDGMYKFEIHTWDVGTEVSIPNDLQ